MINAGTIAGAAGIAFDVNGGGVGGGGVVYDGAINDGSGQSVEVTGRDGGGVTFSGNIADSGDAGGGIVVSGNSDGSTTFSGASKVLNTGASQRGRAGAATAPRRRPRCVVHRRRPRHRRHQRPGPERRPTRHAHGRRHGQLDHDRHRSALNVDTTRITAGNLNFDSISANGATNGIRLNTTGTDGWPERHRHRRRLRDDRRRVHRRHDPEHDAGRRLADLGAGDHAQRMKIRNSLGNGVRGSSVTNFALRDCVVDNNGDDAATDEAGLHFTNLAGTSEFTRTLVANSPEDNARIVNSLGDAVPAQRHRLDVP